jgi:glycosyltransferase involved in cell wall biosynthesis
VETGNCPISRPRYSVVVPAYDEEDLLPATLGSIRAAMAAVPWPGEIVVCDNNSRDRTAEIARAAGALVVAEPHNQIARARNTGARASAGEWLVFVDADTRISGEVLRRALDLLASGTIAGGGSVFHMDCAGSRSGARIVRAWNWISRRFHVAAGSFLFCRRDAFDAVGGFSLGVYAGEELWFTRAVKRWGRGRGLGFRVLDEHPVETSGRKMEWFSPWSLGATLLLMTLCPFLSRSRTFCRIWYRRPSRPGPRPGSSPG